MSQTDELNYKRASQESLHTWGLFLRLVKFSITASVIVLLGMAIFLV